KDPTRPGPCVTATAERSDHVLRDSSSASRTTGTMAFRCSREANSGTTPPYGECVASWDATTELRIRWPSASSTTAAAVSSHDDSMERIRTILRDGQRGGQLRLRRGRIGDRAQPLAGRGRGPAAGQ